MSARLVVLNGKQSGQSVLLSEHSPSVMGRDPNCHLILTDPACSRIQAALHYEEDAWCLIDRGSANGTFLNGERIVRATLVDGDKLLIGSTWIRFLQVQDSDQRGADTPPTWVLEDSITLESSLTSISASTRAESSRADLDCLERVSTAISHHTDPKALVREVLEIVTEHLLAGGAKLLLDRGRNTFIEYQRTSMPVLPTQLCEHAATSTEAVLVPISDGSRNRRQIFAPLRYLDHAEGLLWVVEDADEAPFKHEDLCLVAGIAHVLAPPLKMLLDMDQLQRKHQSLLETASVEVVGRSPAMQQVLQWVARVSDVNQTVLLRGESGVGKEVVARLIHETGRRREQPMICVNCAALSESLLESELFGHEKGAFTGATETRPGKFETADGGTILLDELGAMSPVMQSKMLRVLDGHPFERVGGNSPIVVDVRVLAATNADLAKMVAEGRFREDLYHRLCVIEIHVPPLRERREDIPDLATYFLQRFTDQTGRRMSFETGAFEILERADWPGNVRQLRNVIERAAILNPGPTITREALESNSIGLLVSAQVLPIHDLTRQGIERALAECANVPQAATKLGMSRSALYRHMKKLAITPPRSRPAQ